MGAAVTAMERAELIRLHQLSIEAGDFCLRDVSLQIESGTHACLVGKTGAGKTTLLEAICGLRAVTQGQVWLNHTNVTRFAPNKRNCGYVPQDLALFPTMTVEQQLGFALRFMLSAVKDQRQRVQELAEWLRLTHVLKRYPQHLSGGEKQRVALGRAIAPKPSVLLLDEPFSALDSETRTEMHRLVADLRVSGLTILHVTHHQADVQQLADQVFELTEAN